MVLPACDVEGAAHVAERVRACVSVLHLRADAATLAPVTVSVGVAAVCDARRSTPAGLISAADRAMYEAKHGGRDQVRRQPAVASCDNVPVIA